MNETTKTNESIIAILNRYKKTAKRSLIGAICFFITALFFTGLSIYLCKPMMMFGVGLQIVACIMLIVNYVGIKNDINKLM